MRRPLIVANWKMNKTTGEAAAYMRRLGELINAPSVEIVVAPPFTALHAARLACENLAINLAAFALVAGVVLHAGHPALRILRGRALGYLGQISYGLYLYHMIILRIKLDLAQRFRIGHNFWVDALTWHSVARCVRNVSIASGPSSLGWRRPWKRMYRRIQAQ